MSKATINAPSEDSIETQDINIGSTANKSQNKAVVQCQSTKLLENSPSLGNAQFTVINVDREKEDPRALTAHKNRV